jgi:hypothetical protein
VRSYSKGGMRSTLALLICAAAGAAADDDPVAVLARLRDQVMEQRGRIPNHTCVETVERERYQRVAEQAHQSCDTILARRAQPNFSKLLRLSTTDRLRLDVAVTDGGREIYSWVGASRFEEGEIDELIPQGAMGTGPFATLLLSAFEGRPQQFMFEGASTLAGRDVYEYSFRVLRDESRYRYKEDSKQWIVTGYRGTLLVDPRTSELVRFGVKTDELPPSTRSCEVDTTLDYGKVRLRGGDFLLPAATRQRFIGRDGTEDENAYTFSACRDFQAESTVSFGEPKTDSQPSGSFPLEAPLELPAGLAVSIDLDTAIDSAHAAAGDRIEGRLAKPIRSQDRQTLVPQGAKMVGRLMRVEVEHLPPARVTVVLRWETIDMDGASKPLVLIPNRQAKPAMQAGGLAGLAEALGDLRRRGTQIELPPPGEEHYCVLHFAGEYRMIESGLRTEWLTAKP